MPVTMSTCRREANSDHEANSNLLGVHVPRFVYIEAQFSRFGRETEAVQTRNLSPMIFSIKCIETDYSYLEGIIPNQTSTWPNKMH